MTTDSLAPGGGGVPCAEFDLESARSEMDEQGLRVAEHQESSLRNRRKLAEATRGTCSFRSITLAQVLLFSV